MIKGKGLEEGVYEEEHIEQVLAEMASSFDRYFDGFSCLALKEVFDERIRQYNKEREAYRKFLDLDSLDEFEDDPNAFKSYTRKNCPIIRRCLNSPDEVMKDYQKSFNLVSGRQLLDTVRTIAKFGRDYQVRFHNQRHEQIASFRDLELEPLNDAGCPGVIGYGIQSSLLYGQYASSFAHRSQAAMWTLYFMSNRKDFGLRGGSEFLIARPEDGTCEQNYMYPAELFGFYALKLYLTLKAACNEEGIPFFDHRRYVYLSTFCDYVAESHQQDINLYKWSSTHVESQPWF